MKLGIDFGTTRTLVAVVDRGNFPVVSFTDDDGETLDHIPSIVAEEHGALVYGFDAVAAAKRGAPVVRSLKRRLADPSVTAHTPVTVGAVTRPILEVLTGYLASVRHAILTMSNAPRAKKNSSLDAVVGVPAHAHGAQRYLTIEAFSRAGFNVTAMLHEPSAAGFEYTHRQPKSVSSKRSRVVVYDLGGGTFDASLVSVLAHHHEVLATAGDNHLGGDDLDVGLLQCFNELDVENLDVADLARLLDRCRDAKERITAQAKRVTVDVDGVADWSGSVSIPIESFTQKVEPLIQRTLDVMAPVIGGLGDDDALSEVAGIYVVGGQSALPIVPRLLKERFGRRVHRSPYPAASVAIGLAIAASNELGFSLHDRFSRCFGVFREGNGGNSVRFDPIFIPSTTLPKGAGDVFEVERKYLAVHNVGHYRYVECQKLDEHGEPSGDVVPFGEVVVAFDPAFSSSKKSLRSSPSGDELRDVPVVRMAAGVPVCERYRIDDRGIVTVEIENTQTSHTTRATLGGA